MFTKQSIRWKIILIIFCVCVPSTLIGLSAVSYFDINQTKKELADHLAVSAEMTSDHLSASLAFGDPDNATKILSAFRHNDSVLMACAYDATGKLFASFVADNAFVSGCLIDDKEHEILNKQLLIYRSSVEEGALKGLGVLYLYASLDKISQLMHTQFLFVLGCFFFILLLVSYPLANIIQRTISKPVSDLFEKSKAISQISSNKLEAFNTFDEVYLSMKILEEIKGVAEIYYESIEATEAALNNHKHFIDVLNDKIFSRKKMHDMISRDLRIRPEVEALQIASHGLELHTILHLETEDLLELFRGFYDLQKLILSTARKVRLSSSDITFLVKCSFDKIANHGVPIFIKSDLDSWSIKVYEQAVEETLLGLNDLFYALCYKSLDYRVTVELDDFGHPQMIFRLECLSGLKIESLFDFDHLSVDRSFLRMKYFNNINNPSSASLSMDVEPEQVIIKLLL